MLWYSSCRHRAQRTGHPSSTGSTSPTPKPEHPKLFVTLGISEPCCGSSAQDGLDTYYVLSKWTQINMAPILSVIPASLILSCFTPHLLKHHRNRNYGIWQPARQIGTDTKVFVS